MDLVRLNLLQNVQYDCAQLKSRISPPVSLPSSCSSKLHTVLDRQAASWGTTWSPPSELLKTTLTIAGSCPQAGISFMLKLLHPTQQVNVLSCTINARRYHGSPSPPICWPQQKKHCRHERRKKSRLFSAHLRKAHPSAFPLFQLHASHAEQLLHSVIFNNCDSA